MVHLAGELVCYVLEGNGYGEMLLSKKAHAHAHATAFILCFNNA
jgi:hypothetical protein